MTNASKSLLLSIILFFFIPVGYCQQLNRVWLDDLNIKSFSESIPSVSAKTNAGGDSIKIKDIYFKRGVGVQSLSVLSFYLDEKAKRFTAKVGADDTANPQASFKFFVIGDRKILFSSNEVKVGDQPQ